MSRKLVSEKQIQPLYEAFVQQIEVDRALTPEESVQTVEKWLDEQLTGNETYTARCWDLTIEKLKERLR